MQEKNLRVPKIAADAKTVYITLIQKIEKLYKFDAYFVNYLFQLVLTCSEIAQKLHARALNRTITDG